MTNEQRHFSSTTEFRMWLSPTGHGRYRSWDVGYSYTKGLEVLEKGDESTVGQAKRLIDSFQEKLELPTFVWEHHVVGAFPDIPAYLAGDPENMWYRTPRPSDRTPLRVWIGLTSSGGISAEDLTTRGCTLAAFTMSLANVRPVYLSPYVNLGLDSGSGENALVSWDIRTSPLVLSELLGCLTNASVTRYVGLSACNQINPRVTGGWHDDYDRETLMRQHLGAGEDDLYLPSIHVRDELVTNPVAWIKRQITKYGQQEDE